MEDIWNYAAKRVANKTVAQRIKHSAKLHSFRSALSGKGSLLSKGSSLAGVGVRSALKHIPVPVIGNFLAQIEKTVEDAVRSSFHKKKRVEAPDLETHVKFDLKELSVESLDRYRWKVTEAIEALNKAGDNFESNLRKKQEEGASCDAFLDYAMAYEQARRRIWILQTQCAALETSVQMVDEWLKDIIAGKDRTGRNEGLEHIRNSRNQGVNKAIEDHLTYLQRAGESQGMAWKEQLHGKCDYWCCFDPEGKPDNYATAKDTAAKVLKFITAQMEVTDLPESISACVEYKQKQDEKKKG